MKCASVWEANEVKKGFDHAMVPTKKLQGLALKPSFERDWFEIEELDENCN